MKSMNCAVVALGAVLASSCATKGRGMPQFPTRDELKKLTSGPRPSATFNERASKRSAWDLKGPFPTSVVVEAPRQPSALWQKVAAAAAGRGLIATEAMDCAAREEAAFVAATKELPGSLLRDFIAGRCATGAPQVVTRVFETKAEPSVTDQALVDHVANQVSSALLEFPPGAHVGAAFARSGDQVAVVVASVVPRATLEPVPVLPTGNTVELKGVVEAGTIALEGAVTQGEVLAEVCEDLKLRPLPAFDLRCTLDANDSSAWITVSTRKQGRLLGLEAARVLVWPKGAPVSTWTRPQPVRDGIAANREAIVKELSDLRVKAGRPPLALAVAQSQDNDEVAPFLFDAMSRGDEALADRLALGVAAGWRVEHEISGGNFFAQAAEQNDGSLLLTRMLLSPSTRASLFDPKTTELALGLLKEGELLAMLGSVYEKLEPLPFPASSDALLARLNAERARRGVAAVKGLRLAGGTEPSYGARLKSGELDLNAAGEAFLQEAVNTTQKGCTGMWLVAGSLDEVEFPDAFFSARRKEVVLYATTWRDPNAPWGQVLVLAATTDE